MNRHINLSGGLLYTFRQDIHHQGDFYTPFARIFTINMNRHINLSGGFLDIFRPAGAMLFRVSFFYTPFAPLGKPHISKIEVKYLKLTHNGFRTLYPTYKEFFADCHSVSIPKKNPLYMYTRTLANMYTRIQRGMDYANDRDFIRERGCR